MPSLEEIKKQISSLGYKEKFIELIKMEMGELSKILREDERIEQIFCSASLTQVENLKCGLFVATGNRLIFFPPGFEQKFEDFSYDKITSIQYKTGLAGEIKFIASGKEVLIKGIDSKIPLFAEFVHAHLSNVPPLINGNPHAGKPFPKWQAIFLLILGFLIYSTYASKNEKSVINKESGKVSEIPSSNQRAENLSSSKPVSSAPVDCYALSKFVEAKGHSWLEKSEIVAAAEKRGDCVWNNN